MTIQVILADDHPIIRTSIKKLLERTEDIRVIAEAMNGIEAVTLVSQLSPDVLLLDMSLPLKDGVEVIHELKASGSSTRILAFSAHHDLAYIFGALNSGAIGYLSKDEDIDEIIAAIRGVSRGEEGWLSRKIKAVVQDFNQNQKTKIKLSKREKQVCDCIVLAKTNSKIAYDLQISEKTVEKVISNLFEKFDVYSRVELAVRMVHEEQERSISS
jgi:DNA-binding NarL/FixJ family response regulator